MKELRRRYVICVSLFALLLSAARAEIVITLNNSFIEEFKNRATIDATYTVDIAHKKPNSPAKDGDIHIAGRAPEIGLPVVAEMMNAASQPKALALVHSVEGTGETISVTGAWRIWCEHGGDTEFVQGGGLEPFTTTNPPHVFEIHPLIKLNSINVGSTFKPIVGFEAKDADQAFLTYERTRSRIIPGDSTTKIQTTMAGFNYVDFTIQLSEAPHAISDGTMVFATVLNNNSEEVVHNRRMVFVDGTVPNNRVKTMKNGNSLHVLGIPRIDLALVAFRAKKSQEDPAVLTWSLPYEMIIVAVLP